MSVILFVLLVQSCRDADDAALCSEGFKKPIAIAQLLPIHVLPYHPHLCLDGSEPAGLLPPTNVFMVVLAAILQMF